MRNLKMTLKWKDQERKPQLSANKTVNQHTWNMLTTKVSWSVIICRMAMDGVEGWVNITWNDYSILLINNSYINGSTLNWIPCSDWLSKWVSWAHLTCLGVPALIPCKKKNLWSWLTKCLLSFGKCHQWNCQKKKYLGQYPAILISCLQISKAGIPQMAGFKINMRKK